MNASPPPVSRRVRWLLAALLAVAFALRLWYAWIEPHSDRTYDERYSFQNLGPLLDHGIWEPYQTFYLAASWLPQAAVLGASEALHRLTGIAVLAIHGETADGWSATAYRLARGVVVVWSVLDLFVVFLVGRRLFDERVGLLAAALLAAFGRDLISAGKFKPDTLVVLLTVCAFYAAVALARDDGWRRFAVVGVFVGLAMSAKMTGISAAFAPAAAVLFLGWRRLALWLRLAWAALVSFLTFAALNPYLSKVLRSVLNLSQGYDERAAAAESSHVTVFWRQFEFLAIHHGWVVFGFAMAGLVGLVAVARREAEPRERRLGAFLLVFQVVGYSLLHTGGMSLFRGQNYLSVSPFTSLAAAWAMLVAWRWLGARWPVLGRRALAAAVWGALGLWLVLRPARLVYGEAIPSNWDQAWEFLQLELQPLATRQVSYVAAERQKRTLMEDRALAAILRLDSSTPGEPLDLSDAELLPADDPSLEARLRSGAAAARRFTSRPFASQGKAVVALVHPWRLAVESSPSLAASRDGGAFTAVLPGALAPGDVVALELLLPRGERLRDGVSLEPGGPLPVVTGGLAPKRSRFLTARFAVTGSPVTVRVFAPARLRPAQVEVRLLRFEPPARGGG
jgi:hypothetical protein